MIIATGIVTSVASHVTIDDRTDPRVRGNIIGRWWRVDATVYIESTETKVTWTAREATEFEAGDRLTLTIEVNRD